MSSDTPPPERGPERLTAHDARQLLEQERSARLTQLRALESAGRDADEQVTGARRDSVQLVLTEIDEAFARITAGTYGVCVGCSRPIPVERLEILPYTSSCVPCRRSAS